MVEFYESFHTYTLHYITFLLTAVVETTVFQKKMNLFSQAVVETTAFQKKMKMLATAKRRGSKCAADARALALLRHGVRRVPLLSHEVLPDDCLVNREDSRARPDDKAGPPPNRSAD